MEKESTPTEVSTILSVVLTPEETKEIKYLSDLLGISLSHLGRALIRLGFKDVNTWEKNRHTRLLELIKLGK